MKKLCFLFLTLLVLLAVSSCATTRYISQDEVYGAEYVPYDSYYTIMVYDGNLLLNRYSPARIVSLEGYVGTYTSVVLDVGGLIVTVTGPTILLYPIGYPNNIYMLRGRSYYRWHDNLGLFTRSRPPRGHMAPPPGPGRHEPRPGDRPPQHKQPNPGPGHNQPGHQSGPKAGEPNPRRVPNASPQNTRPNQTPQRTEPRSTQPNVRRNTQPSTSSARPSTQAAPRGSSGGGATRSGSSGARSSGQSGRRR